MLETPEEQETEITDEQLEKLQAKYNRVKKINKRRATKAQKHFFNGCMQLHNVKTPFTLGRGLDQVRWEANMFIEKTENII